MDKMQINIRLSQEQLDAIDKKRIELQPVLGKIPNRSEVVRYALDQYLGSSTASLGSASTTSK
jgi:Arc/MetJ-type ribon-helix-helix transcriptional regulator